jgi:Fe-S cluster assembly protein SufB
MPQWGGGVCLNEINFDDIYYYIKPVGAQTSRLSPGTTYRKISKIRLTGWAFPEAEQKFLAGVGAQYESEVIYHSIIEDLENKGVLFLGYGRRFARASLRL